MEGHSVRIVVAGGGTGGHVQPAVATLQALQRCVPVDALWLGSGGLEQRAAASIGIPHRTIQTGKLRRYVSIHTPIDAVRIPLGILQSLWILRRFQPDAVFATGGYISVPTIIAARILGIPSLSHEQTAIAGLATRINARFCDVVAVSHARSIEHLGNTGARVTLTGNPVRPEILTGDPVEVYRPFGLTKDLPLVYITGGALGAHAINETVRQALPDLLPITQILHQCGSPTMNGDEPRLLAARDALPETLQQRYAVVQFLEDELPGVYAAAALVIGRAGAGTVAELAALGKPSILVPLPGAGGDEQTINARVLADSGGSILLPQNELTSQRLVEEVQRLLNNSDRLAAMAARAGEHGRPDAADRLSEEILTLVKHRVPNGR